MNSNGKDGKWNGNFCLMGEEHGVVWRKFVRVRTVGFVRVVEVGIVYNQNFG